jgi:hypothetical protein
VLLQFSNDQTGTQMTMPDTNADKCRHWCIFSQAEQFMSVGGIKLPIACFFVIHRMPGP